MYLLKSQYESRVSIFRVAPSSPDILSGEPEGLERSTTPIGNWLARLSLRRALPFPRPPHWAP